MRYPAARSRRQKSTSLKSTGSSSSSPPTSSNTAFPRHQARGGHRRTVARDTPRFRSSRLVLPDTGGTHAPPDRRRQSACRHAAAGRPDTRALPRLRRHRQSATYSSIDVSHSGDVTSRSSLNRSTTCSPRACRTASLTLCEKLNGASARIRDNGVRQSSERCLARFAQCAVVGRHNHLELAPCRLLEASKTTRQQIARLPCGRPVVGITIETRAARF